MSAQTVAWQLQAFTMSASVAVMALSMAFTMILTAGLHYSFLVSKHILWPSDNLYIDTFLQVVTYLKGVWLGFSSKVCVILNGLLADLLNGILVGHRGFGSEDNWLVCIVLLQCISCSGFFFSSKRLINVGFNCYVQPLSKAWTQSNKWRSCRV
jgi:hypothetical protein